MFVIDKIEIRVIKLTYRDVACMVLKPVNVGLRYRANK